MIRPGRGSLLQETVQSTSVCNPFAVHRQADVQAKLTMLGLRVDEAEELFTVLDADQSGEAHAQLISEAGLPSLPGLAAWTAAMWCGMGLM